MDCSVSLEELFKKYTNHEEAYRRILFNEYAKGDAKKYRTLKEDADIREEIVKKIFNYFYEKPQDREEFGVVFKENCPEPIKKLISQGNKMKKVQFKTKIDVIHNLAEKSEATTKSTNKIIKDSVQKDIQTECDKGRETHSSRGMETKETKCPESSVVDLQESQLLKFASKKNTSSSNIPKKRTEHNSSPDKSRTSRQTSLDSYIQKLPEHPKVLSVEIIPPSRPPIPPIAEHIEKQPSPITKVNNKDSIESGKESDEDEITDINYPVSLEFFIKYTNYEETLRRILLKKYARGNTTKFSELNKDKNLREKIIKKIYRRFYKNPEKRKDLGVTIKPCPSHIKKLISQSDYGQNLSNAPAKSPLVEEKLKTNTNKIKATIEDKLSKNNSESTILEKENVQPSELNTNNKHCDIVLSPVINQNCQEDSSLDELEFLKEFDDFIAKAKSKLFSKRFFKSTALDYDGDEAEYKMTFAQFYAYGKVKETVEIIAKHSDQPVSLCGIANRLYRKFFTAKRDRDKVHQWSQRIIKETTRKHLISESEQESRVNRYELSPLLPSAPESRANGSKRKITETTETVCAGHNNENSPQKKKSKLNDSSTSLNTSDNLRNCSLRSRRSERLEKSIDSNIEDNVESLPPLQEAEEETSDKAEKSILSHSQEPRIPEDDIASQMPQFEYVSTEVTEVRITLPDYSLVIEGCSERPPNDERDGLLLDEDEIKKERDSLRHLRFELDESGNKFNVASFYSEPIDVDEDHKTKSDGVITKDIMKDVEEALENMFNDINETSVILASGGSASQSIFRTTNSSESSSLPLAQQQPLLSSWEEIESQQTQQPQNPLQSTAAIQSILEMSESPQLENG